MSTPTDDDDPGFLGRGWSFPPRFDAASGRLIPVAAEEDIVESLRVLFITRPGERVMHPRYGCALQDLVFEPMNAETEAAIELAISRAVMFYEPRIELARVAVQVDDAPGGRLKVLLEYRIRATNTRHNVVFPFYLAEGTLLSETPGEVL
ncbi:GPW/gp25 family protein [Rhodobacteraceae bacterium DSL-40]|uniref:GPW/gp25 family protein n=1 Tax=Amaricoccus sp. B4 TaxID=3368557 RepID=UPI000DABE127